MVQYLMVDPKEYEAVLILGTETDSCDRDGKVVTESTVPQNIEERMRAVLPGFTWDNSPNASHLLGHQSERKKALRLCEKRDSTWRFPPDMFPFKSWRFSTLKAPG